MEVPRFKAASRSSFATGLLMKLADDDLAVGELRDDLEPGPHGLEDKEGRLIVFAWSKFLRGGDPVWLPRLPVTKCAVRAMDTISVYFKRAAGAARASSALRL